VVLLKHEMNKLILFDSQNKSLKFRKDEINMTTEKMTVHKALAELKIIGSRIDSAISTGNYVRANKHSNEKINGVSVDDFKKQMLKLEMKNILLQKLLK
jgi:hypothetical protein